MAVTPINPLYRLCYRAMLPGYCRVRVCLIVGSSNDVVVEVRGLNLRRFDWEVGALEGTWRRGRMGAKADAINRVATTF